jgi:hypothetical protein
MGCISSTARHDPAATPTLPSQTARGDARDPATTAGESPVRRSGRTRHYWTPAGALRHHHRPLPESNTQPFDRFITGSIGDRECSFAQSAMCLARAAAACPSWRRQR